MNLADDVEARLAGTVSITTRRPNALARMARNAMSGQLTGVQLVVDDHHPELTSFRLDLPDVDGLSPSVVTDAIATAVGVRRRFGRSIDALRTMSFDLHDAGMVTGHIAGLAALNLGTIHLNAALLTAQALPLPTDALVAHELWHLVELAWEVRDYRRTIEFRRDLGVYFGVATIEHAIRGNADANARVRAEVSAYAATGSREVTAELFQQWWVTGASTPALAHFGALVDRYFPPPR